MGEESEVKQLSPEGENPATPEEVSRVEELEARAIEEEKRLERMLREDKESVAKLEDQKAMDELEERLKVA